jgi:hypothetical protein
MAIDMIENNDLSALAKGRLGDLNSFADENKGFKNFAGNEEVFQKIDVNEEFENLFGINIFGDETFKRNKAKAKSEAEEFVKKLPKTTCDDLKSSLDKLALYIEAQTKELGLAKGHVTEYPKIRLTIARAAEADMKMKQEDKQCIAIAQKLESEQKKAELIKTLTNVSEASVQQAKTDLFGVPSGQPLYAPASQGGGLTASLGQNKNLLIYGGIGLGAILLLAMLRNR